MSGLVSLPVLPCAHPQSWIPCSFIIRILGNMYSLGRQYWISLPTGSSPGCNVPTMYPQWEEDLNIIYQHESRPGCCVTTLKTVLDIMYYLGISPGSGDNIEGIPGLHIPTWETVLHEKKSKTLHSCLWSHHWYHTFEHDSVQDIMYMYGKQSLLLVNSFQYPHRKKYIINQ